MPGNKPLIIVLVVLVLSAVSYYFYLVSSEKKAAGIPDLSKAAVTPDLLSTRNPTAQETYKAALQAQVDRNYPEARKLLLLAREQDTALPGIDFRLAVLAFYEGKMEEARLLLEKSLAAGEEVDASHNLLGSVLAGQEKYKEAAEQFKQAALAAPGDARIYYNWSQALRASGQPSDAVEKLNRAIELNPRELSYPFKQKLAQIEAGQESVLEKETAAQLLKTPPPGDWLMIAAGIALKRGNFAEASTIMTDAERHLPPALFQNILQDPLFKQQASRPEISRFYPKKP